jgi:hypothetical protein
MNKNEVFTELKNRGIIKVEVEFSGGNDEGGCDGIHLFDANGNTTEMEEHYDEYCGMERNFGETETVDEQLSFALCKPVYDKYYGFAFENYNGMRLQDKAEEYFVFHVRKL